MLKLPRTFAAATATALLLFGISPATDNSFTNSNQHGQIAAFGHPSGRRLAFVPNVGQWDREVLYRAQGVNAAAWFSATRVTYEFQHSVDLGNRNGLGAGARASVQPYREAASARFVGANAGALVVAEGAINYRTNYFVGRDKKRWKTDVPSYTHITYKSLYSGIDLTYYAKEEHLEYDLVVAPKGRIEDIEIAYEGTSPLEISPDGTRLTAHLGAGRVVEHSPIVYYVEEGVRHDVPARFIQRSSRSFGFEVLQPRHPEFALVIDPAISFGTDFGGNDDEDCMAMTTDASGAVYICGNTSSTQFPKVNAVDLTYSQAIGSGEAFVAKILPGNSVPVFSTYLGGNNSELCWDIALDGSNNPIVVGKTRSADFPMAGTPIKSTLGNMDEDAFVSKIATGGNTLMFSTYLGGSGYDEALCVAVNSSNEVWIGGFTSSSAFPLKKSPLSNTVIDSTYAAVEGFLTRISSTGNALVYSTYVGGSLADEVDDIAIDKLGNIHLLGTTASTNFPTLAAYDNTLGGASDYVVLELSSTDVLQYSTYLGGSLTEGEYSGNGGGGITADSTGATYVVGGSYSADYPLLNQYSSQNSPNRTGIVTKILPNGSGLMYSSRLGPGYTDLHAVKVDDSGRMYIVGEARDQFPMSYYGYDQTYGSSPNTDAVLAVLSANGQQLLYGSYLGGANSDVAYDVALGAGYKVIVSGSTYNEVGWPLVNRLDTAYEGPTNLITDDAAIAIFNDPVSYVPTNTTVGNQVNVTLPFNWYTIFKHVTDTGTTRVTMSNSGPTPPANFQVVPSNPPVFYNISTTAHFTDTIFTCFQYNESQIVGNEADLKVYHYSGGAWHDCTYYLSTSTNQICGAVTSLSPFMIGIPSPSCCTGTTGNVNMTGSIDLADLSSLVSYLTGGGYVPPCAGEANINAVGSTDLADLSSLIRYLTGGGYVLPNCP